jgi:hypothetical protein
MVLFLVVSLTVVMFVVMARLLNHATSAVSSLISKRRRD